MQWRETIEVEGEEGAVWTLVRDPRVSIADYIRFCDLNPEMRVERTSEGILEIMPPAGLESSYGSGELVRQLGNWAVSDGRGVVFDSSSQFILPSGAARSPDAAWVQSSRLATLSAVERSRFPNLAPDFVVEITSPSDRLSNQHRKMREWMDGGVQLGWLIDLRERTVHIYHWDGSVTKHEGLDHLQGEPPLDGFTLSLARIWTF